MALPFRKEESGYQFDYPVTVVFLLNIGNLYFLHVTWTWPVNIIIYYHNHRYLAKEKMMITSPKLKEIFLYVQSLKSQLWNLLSFSYY